ncbi:alpha-N-methyltransferase NTM1 [Aspergillus ambiguus]|uniref:alpha-N-methyltransferase NTM1 n=1 Tax=Aspergillus ambiguus TaxID=176160 RepID=UPI003CCE3F6F
MPSERAEDPHTPSSPPADSYIDHAAAISYWNGVPATINGILGGFPQISHIDLRGSKNFFARIRRSIPACASTGKLRLGVDCGAGIGRVTEGFLSQVCEVVDVVEPVEKFSSAFRNGALKESGIIGDVYAMGLEHWSIEKRYDIIWAQWCLGHLTDAQLIEFLERCCTAMTESGIMVVKENLSTDPSGGDIYDDVDSSVTRSDKKFRDIFNAAGMNVVMTELQGGFPKNLNLLPVRSYALRPIS